MKSLFPLLLLCLFLSPTFLCAQWQLTQSPYPGYIRDVDAFAGGYVAATAQGLYRSTDGGFHWEIYTPPGLEHVSVWELDVLGNRVLVRGSRAEDATQLFYSADGGYSFQPVPTDLPKPVGLYESALWNNYLYAETMLVLYRSADLGQTWEAIPGQVRNLNISGNRMFHSIFNKLYTSDNGGFDWTLRLNTANDIATYMASGDTILAAEKNTTTIYRSYDGGQSWQTASLAFPPYAPLMRFTKFKNRYILDSQGHVYASDDQGKTWTDFTSKAYPNSIYRCFSTDNNVILRGSEYGMHRSADGASFEPASFGLQAGYANTLRDIEGVFYAATDLGLYRLAPDGQHWAVWQRGSLDSFFNSNDIMLNDDRFVVGHTWSDDFGKTWSSNTEYLLTYRFAAGGNRLMAYTNTNYKYSQNNGASWTSELSGGIVLIRSTPDGVWRVDADKKLRQSTNGGKNWTVIGDTLPIPGPYWPSLYDIAVSGNHLMVAGYLDGAGNRIWVSDNNGASWTAKPAPGDEQTTPQYSLFIGNYWLLACSNGGVYYSTDYGDHWTPFNEGLRFHDANFLAVYGDDLWLSGAGGIWKRPLAELNLYPYQAEVWFDQNGNQQRDAGEPPVPGVPVQSTLSGNFATTNAAGQCRLFATGNTDSVRALPTKPYLIASPAVQAVQAPGGTASFGLRRMPNVYDLAVVLTPQTPPRPGFETFWQLNCRNDGTESTDGELLLSFPAGTPLSGLVADPPAQQISDTSWQWSITTLDPGASTAVKLQFHTDATAPLGEDICLTAKISLAQNDTMPFNNVDRVCALVVGAYDPNDKLAEPAERLSPAEAAAGRPMQYTVRFQNTGTLPAAFVRIVDTLQTGFDQASFRLLASSHPCQWTLRNPGVLEFLFNPIDLPPASDDEASSQGFVAYSVSPKATLPSGTPLFNTAHIYFDYNLPVITNTTETLFAEPLATQVLSSGLKLSVYPNPANTKVTLAWPAEASVEKHLLLRNTLGQTVLDLHLNETGISTEIELESFAPGAYFWEVLDRTGNRIDAGPLVIQR